MMTEISIRMDDTRKQAAVIPMTFDKASTPAVIKARMPQNPHRIPMAAANSLPFVASILLFAP
ncbi:hypothetical protein [Hyphomonas pacifica]|uniref:hypothetical protein n=1 Tax=Hyphomonas pacifica TaxID=1280941 RepID=UPI0011B94391|nr:hypothetical protein [Hyphomonas pacifica]